MRKSEIVLLVLSVLILKVSCDGWNKYDYLQVVIQWQPATCSELHKPPCYQSPTNRFSIHGMWPSLYSGHLPRCRGSLFDINQVGMLLPQLSDLWHNVVTGDDLWLWGHEWDRHGICTQRIFSQQTYFIVTMNSYIQNNLQFVLANNQITPNGQTYTADQIQAAIRATTGATPAVRCNYNRRTQSPQLHEITLCYNSDATAFVDCPPVANKCSHFFEWYSWN